MFPLIVVRTMPCTNYIQLKQENLRMRFDFPQSLDLGEEYPNQIRILLGGKINGCWERNTCLLTIFSVAFIIAPVGST